MTTHTHLSERISRRRLDVVYPMPGECQSLSEWQLAQHLDLPELDGVDLDGEHFLVAHRLATESDQYHRSWLAQQAIEAECRRRAGGRR